MPELSSLVDSLIGPLVAALLTIMVLSYLIGDNPLFRMATHVFVGVAAGYAGSLALRNVLEPGLITPLLAAGVAGLTDTRIVLTVLIPWVLVLMLLLKVSPATARLGTPSVALLVGVGAAVVVGGAITGTLIPQSLAAMSTLSPSAVSPQTGETGVERMVNVVIMLVGTLSTLLYFRFTARRAGPVPAAGSGAAGNLLPGRLVLFIGRFFIAVTFGVMYAGALAAAIIVLAERVQFLRSVVVGFLGGG